MSGVDKARLWFGTSEPEPEVAYICNANHLQMEGFPGVGVLGGTHRKLSERLTKSSLKGHVPD